MSSHGLGFGLGLVFTCIYLARLTLARLEIWRKCNGRRQGGNHSNLDFFLMMPVVMINSGRLLFVCMHVCM